MIHIILGGSLSGKTTYVKNKYLSPVPGIKKLEGIPVTVGKQGELAVGWYNRDIRTVGVDQMGRDYKKIHERLMDLICVYAHTHDIVMEGNAVADPRFLTGLKGFPVKLTLIWPDAKTISMRYKKLGLNYGRSIVAMSYKRALKSYEQFKEVFPSEIIN